MRNTEYAAGRSSLNLSDRVSTSSHPSPRINVRVRDQKGYEMVVRMKMDTKMSFLMREYTTRAVRDRDDVRFLFDGEKISEKDTPQKVRARAVRLLVYDKTLIALSQLGLISDECTEVFFFQIGG